jgi:2-keto-4-pentenoate hydratase/2-oxohepta-3-ene-1,7-dioic acid hydratase in catechol pathway
MQLMRLGPPGSEIPAVLTAEGTHLDLRPLTSDIDGAFLAGPGLDQARAAVRAGTLPALDAAGLRVGPPVARPSAVLCIGMNYAAHAAETGAAPPERPVLFYKAPNTVVGPDDTVLNPRGATKLDWEVELAVVIGTRVRYLESAQRALDHVAGYAISNDVSERYFQIEISGGQWSKGKSCETFNPLGPWLVTADEVADPQALRLRTRVNGAARQDSTTRDMVFTVAELIYQLSQVTVLEPGDIINTGTPQGVALSGRFPYLVPGDTVELEIDGLGRQRQLIAQA